MKPKKYLALLLSLCLFCSMTAQATVVEAEARSGEEKVFISSLNQEQCIEQLSELGVVIPQELSGIDFKKLVASFEADPNLQYVVNYTVASDFFKEVRNAVNRYHGWADERNTTSSTRYTLQNSTLTLGVLRL